MTRAELLNLLIECPLVASAQASPNSPLEDPKTLARIALASAGQGVKVIRAQGTENIRAIKAATGLPVIGLIKKDYPGSEVYITPTLKEVEALLRAGCEVIALDGTARSRPGSASLGDLIKAIHEGGALALADCDCEASAAYAVESGTDLVSTTLSGYTPRTTVLAGPDLGLVRNLVKYIGVPVLAEGRFAEPHQVQLALRIGAAGVVVGGALNDPVKQTERFLKALPFHGNVGAVDIGGTWLRFGVFSVDWKLLHQERVALPAASNERTAWIMARIREHEVQSLGVSAGGTIEPRLGGTVTQAKAIVPNYVGTWFGGFGLPTISLNDGLATAWGHACLPEFAGRRVATLALGTGVGCGLVDLGSLVMGFGGQTLKLNDLPTSTGKTFEELLGGAALSPNPSESQRDGAKQALVQALRTLQAMTMPDVIVICGGVGLAPWLDVEGIAKECFWGADAPNPAQPHSADDLGWQNAWVWPRIVRSPFGADAGLYGAAALALFPPVDLAERMAAWKANGEKFESLP
ncbi:MAG: putative N-acetylmannosamine-6-phosphate 2-epimerase [Armatimonadetes bacterium]|nr:putative N-acetylmannosamine-6-phosphate 2-epimerase [Armatimonadota bacterium]